MRIPSARTDSPSPEPEIPDAATVESWFLRYSHTIFLVCRKYLKDEEECRDAVMDIFHKLLAEAGKHRVSNVPAWLHAVTKNHCLMRLRKTSRLKMIFRPLLEKDAAVVENADFLNLTGRKLPDCETLLAGLVPEQRSCVELFYLKRKSYREIAALVGVPERQVKSRIQNGRRNLKIAAARHLGGEK
ncbi:MAG: sigma-70 family RNA polymerase sigma factor [bacterium]|nr:sigma-70 family RNA polymerase sigma factor [bacterium]